MRCARFWFGIVVLGLAASGCSPDSHPAPPADVIIEPIRTPDQLAAAFLSIYEERNAAGFEALLDTSFVMPLRSAALAAYPDLGPAVERAEALRMHGRLFGGQDVLDPNQQVIPAVRDIQFQSFSRQGLWAQAAPGDVYPGTTRAWFDVMLQLDRGQSYAKLYVMGSLQFHVAVRDTMLAGTPTTYCRLRAITDMTQDDGLAEKSSEAISLGRLWGLWR